MWEGAGGNFGENQKGVRFLEACSEAPTASSTLMNKVTYIIAKGGLGIHLL